MLVIRDLYLKQGEFTLQKINLEIEQGTLHVLIGPTGCGKTTLLEAILGLRKIERGQILLNGKDITHMPIYKRGFAYVPQDLALFPHLSARKNILFGLKYGHSQNRGLKEDELIDLIKFLQIESILDKKIFLLSGGEKQRVALARALAAGCKYLLLDEPFTAISPGLKKDLWVLLKDLQRKYELTILMVSHDPEETFFLGDYVSVIISGKIIQSDKKDIVYEQPATLEVANYFGIKNIFSGKILAKSGDCYQVWCNELEEELLIPKENLRLEEEGDLLFFIRRENIMILRKDLPWKGENLIAGTVKAIHFLGEQYLIKVSTERTNFPLDISLPGYAFNKLGLREEDKVILSLRKEKIYTIA